MDTFSPHFDWLRVFPCLRSKCFICNKIESFGSDEIEGLYCNECLDEYSDVLDDIRLQSYSTSGSGSSQETNDTDSDD